MLWNVCYVMLCMELQKTYLNYVAKFNMQRN